VVPTMETLPSELLEDIFSLVCTDNGGTGCALAAVSHSMRKMSAPMRYNAVALRGARQIRAFLALLRTTDETAPQNLEPPVFRVCHLFIADCTARLVTWEPNWEEWRTARPQRTPRGLMGKLVRKLKSEKALHAEMLADLDTLLQCHEAAQEATCELLAHVSTTLVHLSFHRELRTRFFLVPVRLPMLAELTSRDCEPWSGDTRAATADSEAQKLPALRRLHCVGNAIHAGQFGDFDALVFGRLPPSLTHLRHTDNTWPAYLLEALSRIRMASGAAWPVGLQTILVAPRPQSLYHTYGNKDAMVAGADITPLVRAVAPLSIESLFKRIMVEDAYNVDRMYEEWLDRTQGGAGCWVEGKPF
jgi:hypothetical protein